MKKVMALGLLLFLVACSSANVKPGFIVQMQNPDPSQLVGLNVSAVIVSTMWNGQQVAEFDKPNASVAVLGYLSIGMSDENFGDSWPDWVGAEVDGLRHVKYWESEWQQRMVTQLRVLLEANYSGVFIDNFDVYSYWDDQNYLHTQDLMIDLIEDLSVYSKNRDENFMIVVRNGFILDDPRYIAAIDGVSDEEVWYSDNFLHSPRKIAEAEKVLDDIKGKGKKIFVIDYPTRKEAACDVYSRAEDKGYLGYVGVPALDKVVWFECG
jgi:uncharacterized protein (TIGR01370 family)